MCLLSADFKYSPELKIKNDLKKKKKEQKRKKTKVFLTTVCWTQFKLPGSVAQECGLPTTQCVLAAQLFSVCSKEVRAEQPATEQKVGQLMTQGMWPALLQAEGKTDIFKVFPVTTRHPSILLYDVPNP